LTHATAQPTLSGLVSKASGNQKTGGPKMLARNKKARHDYKILESMEAGLSLVGSEVKSIRDGRAVLTDAFVEVLESEAWLTGMEIALYEKAHNSNHEPRRRRKLLLHRKEIDKMAHRIKQKGITVVPTALYDKGGRIKAEVAIVEGKQDWDRRQDVKAREAKRDIDRALAGRKTAK
jgi:SsrA-binding protein